MDQQKLAEIWGNVQELMSAGGAHYGEAVQQAIKEVGLEGLRLGLLLHAFQFEPSPITADALQITIPYYATEPFEEGFQKLDAHGFLEGDHQGYRLSTKGRQALLMIFGAAQHKLADVEKSLQLDDLQALQEMLQRLYDAAADHQEIAEKLCFKMQIRTMSDKTLSILSDIEDLVSNLYSFRCDGHRHTWQQLDYDLDGPTWEALTALWQGDANSVATITEHRLNARPTRGFGDAIYAKSVETLVSYGWVELDNIKSETYRLTDIGKNVRQDAEDETNRLFYSIWSVLSESELDKLNSLALQVCEQLGQLIVAM
jgi:DNA-binding PadR family transcriptional regulator